MSKYEPIEFGENGAVLNSAYMRPEVRASYCGQQQKAYVDSDTFSLSGVLAGFVVTAIGLTLLKYFDAELSRLQYGVYFLLITSAAHLASRQVIAWRRNQMTADRPERLVEDP